MRVAGGALPSPALTREGEAPALDTAPPVAGRASVRGFTRVNDDPDAEIRDGCRDLGPELDDAPLTIRVLELVTDTPVNQLRFESADPHAIRVDEQVAKSQQPANSTPARAGALASRRGISSAAGLVAVVAAERHRSGRGAVDAILVLAGLNHHAHPVVVDRLGLGSGICSPGFGKREAGGFVAFAAGFETVE